MRTHPGWTPLLALALAGSMLSGCGKTNPLSATPGATGGSPDAAQAADAVAAAAPAIDDGLMEAADAADVSSSAPVGSAALIHPLHYWRHITDVRRTFEFAFSDTDSTGRPRRADVTIHKTFSGTFNIAFDSTPGDSMPFDSVAKIRKPLHDLWTRRVLLRRVPGPMPDDTEWRVAALSGVDVRSFDPNAPSANSLSFGATEILRLRIQSASGDTLITDPLRYFWLRRLPVYEPGEDVTLTVTTKSNTDVVVMARPGLRRRFHNNGDNTYTLFWKTSAEDGLHHFGISALSNGTLFDDQAPYDSDAWILPYRVNPSQVAEYMP